MGYLTHYLSLFGLLFFHELGHYISVRRAGIPVETFQVGIGFGPKFKLGDMKVKFGFIPILGFVLPDLAVYESASRKTRFLTAFCGPFASALLGFILIAFSGMPILNALIFTLQLWFTIPFMVFGEPSLLMRSASSNTMTAAVTIANLLSFTPSQSLHIIGVLSIIIAGFNLLPVPPLDGGRLLFEVLDAFFGKVKLPIEINGKQLRLVSLLQGIVLVTFVLYMLYSTVVDLWSSLHAMFR